MSDRATEEITRLESRYESYRHPRVLDIMDIPMTAPVPRDHQTENHRIAAGKVWKKAGELRPEDLGTLIETPATLWSNGDSTSAGRNNRVAPAIAAQFTGSLYLIRPQSVTLRVQSSQREPEQKRALAEFLYKGAEYRLVVTDPVAESEYIYRDDGDYPLPDVLLCVSLTEPWEGDRRCHKLVTTIIREPRR